VIDIVNAEPIYIAPRLVEKANESLVVFEIKRLNRSTTAGNQFNQSEMGCKLGII
jgi:hypothetical protein